MDIDQEFLDALDAIIGDVPAEPEMFSAAWWNGGFGEEFLADHAAYNSRGYRWPSPHNGWPSPVLRVKNV